MTARPTSRVLLATTALVAMFVLGLVVTHDNWVTRADLDIVRTAAADRSAVVAQLARAISWLGNILVLSGLSAASAVVLRRRGAAWARALLPASAVAVAAVLDPLAKLAVGRPRPPADLAAVVETATGYPSGHSAQAMAFWLSLAFAIAAGSGPQTRRRVIAAGVAVAAMVGLSRVVLGVHSPTDVLGGWLLGLACALLVVEVQSRLAQADLADARPAS